MPLLSWLRASRWLALGACLPAAALVWLGYRAVVEWEHAAEMVASKRAEAAANLLIAALARDMRGAQLLVLSAADSDGVTRGTGVDLLDPITDALARYPYPDVFFSWRAATDSPSVVFYSRAERRPSWLSILDPANTIPVVVGREPQVAARLIERVMKDGTQGRRFSVFDLAVANSNYQVVAALSYTDARQERPATVLGFMVNLDWVRGGYFRELTAQVARIESRDGDLDFAVLDERGRSIAGGPTGHSSALAGRRVFPVAFFDPMVVAIDPPADLDIPSWTAVVGADRDVTLASAGRAAGRTLAVAAAMALALTAGLFLSLRAGRASAKLAEMRSDFVSAVTHELKTPIANMRAISETLSSGRATPEMTREYAQMGLREANRLARLIDNLLAYARITDVADLYAFEPVALEAIVDCSLQEFTPHLTDEGFEVHVDLPEELPAVRADSTALRLMLNNLLDNAIRYSGERRHVTVAARRSGSSVVLSVTDQGVGIPASEIGRVTRKFFRGRHTAAGGSGLGLAIVDRIVSDHGGRLEITSVAGAGTTAAVTLPIVPA